MDITPIKTQRDYRRVLKEIDSLMMAKRNTPEGDRLDMLVTLVEAWERDKYPLDLPDPIEAVKYHMEQNELAPRDLIPFVAPEMPRFSLWSVCAFGRREAACVTAAALLGGHGRVGFENNLTLPTGARAASNAELVAAATRALDAVGLATQTAEGLREEIATAMGT